MKMKTNMQVVCVHWSLDALVSHKWQAVILHAGEKLTLMDLVRVDVISLGYLVRLPHTCTYMVMVTALCEWW